MSEKRLVDSGVYKNIPSLTMTERFNAANRTAAYIFVGYHKALAEEFGEEKAIEIGKKATTIYAPLIINDVARLIGVEQMDDLLTNARVLAVQEEQILGAASTCLEASPKRLVRSMSYCPWGEIVPPGVCTAMIEGCDLLYKTSSSYPDYKVTHDSSYHATGICRYVVEKIK